MPQPSAPAPSAARIASPDLTTSVFAELDRRLSRRSEAPLAIALSGGGDSMALLQLASAWCAQSRRRLMALTVDHGLHSESADWTETAGRAARAAGADWRPLVWTGLKPTTGLPAAARRARHGLLAEAARAAGASVILLAHTLDDVLEAERMREADTPGLPRLADWGPSPAWPEGRGVFLLRPLLSIRRETLREALRQSGVGWLDDPANQDLRFARARARAGLGGARGGGPVSHPDAASRPPVLVEAETTADGRLLLARPALGGRALAAALLCAGGGVEPPRGPALARLLARLKTGEPFQATLAGARIVAGLERVALGREPGRRGLSALYLAPDAVTVWDGRFEIIVDRAGLRVVPLVGHMARLEPGERSSLAAIPAWARGALPAILGADGSVCLPRPWGRGPAEARALAALRFAAACGEIAHEDVIRARNIG